MAAMIDADRQDAARKWIHKAFLDLNATATLDTVAIKAAIDAADDWVDANAGSFNTALPAAFRTTATLAQKALLIAFVAMKRGNLI